MPALVDPVVSGVAHEPAATHELPLPVVLSNGFLKFVPGGCPGS